MRYTLLAGLALVAAAARPAVAEGAAPALLLAGSEAHAAAAVRSSDVQVWLDGNRDLLRPNDRVRVRVRAPQGAYVAVFHIDTNGDLDILYPRSPNDEGWLDPGRTLALGTRGGPGHLRVRGGPGMGYVFAVALDEPLELWRMHDLFQPRMAGWDARRTIWGDPFYAMDEIIRAIVPEGAEGYESVDHYTYHMGQRYTYPRYACYDGYGDWYYGRTVHWTSCDRVRVILVNRPYYYDTRRWRGSRRVYYERYYTPVVRVVQRRPLHGYKESTQAYAPPTRTVERRPQPSSAPAVRTGSGAGEARPSTGPATRPTRESGPASRPAREAQPAARPTRESGPASRPAREAQPAARPARESAPASRPTREAQPASRPARESAPASRPTREAQPASRPERESAPASRPTREVQPASRPARESAPASRPAREAQPASRPARESAPASRPAREAQPASRPARESTPASRPTREAQPASRPARESSPSSRPARTRPPESASLPTTSGFQLASFQQDPQDREKGSETSRARPTFQRRPPPEPSSARPNRDSPQRDSRPPQDTGRSRGNDSAPPPRPPSMV